MRTHARINVLCCTTNVKQYAFAYVAKQFISNSIESAYHFLIVHLLNIMQTTGTTHNLPKSFLLCQRKLIETSVCESLALEVVCCTH